MCFQYHVWHTNWIIFARKKQDFSIQSKENKQKKPSSGNKKKKTSQCISLCQTVVISDRQDRLWDQTARLCGQTATLCDQTAQPDSDQTASEPDSVMWSDSHWARLCDQTDSVIKQPDSVIRQPDSAIRQQQESQCALFFHYQFRRWIHRHLM